VLPAKGPADEHEQHRQGCQQDTGFHEVAHGVWSSRPKGSSRPLDRQATAHVCAVMGAIRLTRGNPALY